MPAIDEYKIGNADLRERWPQRRPRIALKQSDVRTRSFEAVEHILSCRRTFGEFGPEQRVRELLEEIEPEVFNGPNPMIERCRLNHLDGMKAIVDADFNDAAAACPIDGPDEIPVSWRVQPGHER